MPKVKIEDLTDAQLDHFCAIAQGWKDINAKHQSFTVWSKEIGDGGICEMWSKYHPTTNATQCDEIREREKIGAIYRDYYSGVFQWDANSKFYGSDKRGFGTTAKQAIIRCFIKSKLGEEVDIKNDRQNN